jgi:hypothetical protein
MHSTRTAGLAATTALATATGLVPGLASAVPAFAATGNAIARTHAGAGGAVAAATKKKKPSAVCEAKAQVYVAPCVVKETTNGQIAFTLVGQNLPLVDVYSLHAEALDASCGSDISTTAGPLDLLGRFNDTFYLGSPSSPCTAGTYYISVQADLAPFQSYTTKLVVKHP